MFKLHENLQSKIEILDLDLSKVLLENNSYYPWLILVPKKEGISNFFDLNWEDQLQAMKELNQCEQVIQKVFHPDQINVAALGNVTPQLHIHLIGRFRSDPAWPKAVWDYPAQKAYENGLLDELVLRLTQEISGI